MPLPSSLLKTTPHAINVVARDTTDLHAALRRSFPQCASAVMSAATPLATAPISYSCPKTTPRITKETKFEARVAGAVAHSFI
ncbi:uncharacterized protein RAG0_12076 [Rhynchosporium agropyri]|uniref:Uncharacterized protein n=1 Tax=Rhynchosporium agropyri TaxID=914238 RepID=A0A1E1L9K7_9HELO|nr:uncharacterized protein RAG0_12076 [Rhynchosporium agropyri]